MIFPEFSRHDQNVLKFSKSFLKGVWKRMFTQRTQKVFVIGFHKTGTTSLGKALQILGYKVCGSLKEAYDYNTQENPREYIFSRAKEQLKKYEAFQDTPWFLFYRELYELYPDAYYILTIRPEDKWIKSVQKHFGKNKFHYHDLIYKDRDSITQEVHYRKIYNEHNENVISFFKGKANLKVLNVECTEWKDLGSFLNTSTPKSPFPHANKAEGRGSFTNTIRKIVKKIYYQQKRDI